MFAWWTRRELRYRLHNTYCLKKKKKISNQELKWVFSSSLGRATSQIVLGSVLLYLASVIKSIEH